MRRIFEGRKKFIYFSLFLIIGLSNLLFFNKSKTSIKTEKPIDVIASDGEAISQDPQINEDDIVAPSSTPGNKEQTDVLSVANNPEKERGQVVKVRDGDTIEVEIGGVTKVVRYIGIDSPETVDPRKPVQCFGKEASNKNKELVEGKTVELEKDVSETDKYGRLLRYVYVGDLFVNKSLVEQGYAHSSSYPPDVRLQSELDQAEQTARANNSGLWSSCGSTNSPVSTKFKSTNTTNPSNDKDCSDFSTHQEAQDYFNSKGGSSTNNVDKLDGSDHDGQVCETLP